MQHNLVRRSTHLPCTSLCTHPSSVLQKSSVTGQFCDFLAKNAARTLECGRFGACVLTFAFAYTRRASHPTRRGLEWTPPFWFFRRSRPWLLSSCSWLRWDRPQHAGVLLVYDRNAICTVWSVCREQPYLVVLLTCRTNAENAWFTKSPYASRAHYVRARPPKSARDRRKIIAILAALLHRPTSYRYFPLIQRDLECI